MMIYPRANDLAVPPRVQQCTGPATVLYILFGLLPWTFPPTNCHGYFRGSGWKKIYFHASWWKKITSMEVSGSFHGKTWKFPLSLGVESSANILCGGFHDLPHTPTHFHLSRRVSQTYSCFHKTSEGCTDFRAIQFRVRFHQLPLKFRGN